MATLDIYRTAVKTLIEQYAQFLSTDQQLETQVIMDEVRDHYQLVRLGWEDVQRVYGCLVHIDIKDGIIWIQHNSTEFDVDDDLIALGVAKEDIALGFRLFALPRNAVDKEIYEAHR